MKTTKLVFNTLLLALCWISVSSFGEQPPKLSKSAIETLKQDGDRLAEQGDFLGALEKYTTAYLGVVSGIRGQNFSDNVLPNIYDRDELGEEMLRMMKEEYSQEELELMDSSYKAFDLIPRELDSQKLITQLLTEEVAGFYDPDKKRMVLIVEDGSSEEPTWLGKLFGAKSAFDKDEQKTTLAHELTHALQDQLYDLNAMQKRIEKDDDMALAFSALVEGDATLLMFVEMDDSQDIRNMDPDAIRATFNIMSWMLPLAGGDAYRKAPPIFRDTLIFPYFQGMLFVLSAARENGWEGIHGIYSNPPVSTEQILHPAKYLDPTQRDMPQTITIPDLSPIVGEPWKHLGGNVLGELQTSILFKRIAAGNKAAEGWDGDRYEIFKSPGGELGLVSVSIWDSEKDAEEFADAYRRYRSSAKVLKQTNSDNRSPVDADATPQATESPATRTQVEPPLLTIVRTDNQVWIVEGFDANLRTAIIDSLDESQISEKTFPQ